MAVSVVVQIRAESVGGSPRGPSIVGVRRAVSPVIKVTELGFKVTTATGTTMVIAPLPFTFSDVAVTVIGPGWNACTNPPGDTDAFVPAFVLQAIVLPVRTFPLASFGVAVNWRESSSFRVAEDGVTVTDATGTGPHAAAIAAA